MAAFARDWKADRHREQQTTGRGTFVPLAFQPGEAFQFDWSEDWAVLAGNAPSCRWRTSNYRIAGPFWCGPISFKPMRCCLTRITTPSGFWVACHGAGFTTTCARPLTGLAVARTVRSMSGSPRWSAIICSIRSSAIPPRAGKGSGREERAGRTAPAVATDAELP